MVCFSLALLLHRNSSFLIGLEGGRKDGLPFTHSVRMKVI